MIHCSCNPLSSVQLLRSGIDERRLGLYLQSSSFSRCLFLQITSLIFYAYQLFQQPGTFHAILQGCRLLPQFDKVLLFKVEPERLEHLCQNQVSLRAADYRMTCEHFGVPRGSKNDVFAVQSGHLCNLISTSVGGDRSKRKTCTI